jgi:hypothetical protein
MKLVFLSLIAAIALTPFFIPSSANGQPTKITEVRPELKPTKEARPSNPLTPQKHFLSTETGRK